MSAIAKKQKPRTGSAKKRETRTPPTCCSLASKLDDLADHASAIDEVTFLGARSDYCLRLVAQIEQESRDLDPRRVKNTQALSDRELRISELCIAVWHAVDGSHRLGIDRLRQLADELTRADEVPDLDVLVGKLRDKDRSVLAELCGAGSSTIVEIAGTTRLPSATVKNILRRLRGLNLSRTNGRGRGGQEATGLGVRVNKAISGL